MRRCLVAASLLALAPLAAARLLIPQPAALLHEDGKVASPGAGAKYPDGVLVRVRVRGSSQWQMPDAQPLPGWEFKFFTNIATHEVWGCSDSDDGSTLMRQRKCVEEGSAFLKPKDDDPSVYELNADVSTAIGQVNRYVGTVPACKDGGLVCPEESRSFSGVAECVAVGTTAENQQVGQVGLKAKLQGAISADWAPPLKGPGSSD